MATRTSIEWTDTTWNPVTGCNKVSPGCKHCYAERMAKRLKGMGNPRYTHGFQVTLHDDLVELPLRWRKPRRIFVNSMSDLFHDAVPTEFITKVFTTMEQASQHQFQVLTKRSSRLRDYVNRRYRNHVAPPHIWLGVSVEDGGKLSRVRHLKDANASVRFLSIEPLVGPIDTLDLEGIHWVILGGESGPRARPLRKEWAISIRDQCGDANVPFFFKQWGGIRPKSGGRKLVGREWNEYPNPPIPLEMGAASAA